MKVFLSWSGELSQKIALELRDWLPYVIQSVEPYVSSEDIDKGSRWSIDIAKELEDSSFGILCVTHQNLDSSWLNFEAGALSKAFNKTNVTPFLFGLKPSDLTNSPLLQFQTTLFDKKDLLKLVFSINNANGDEKLNEQKLKITFELWYDKLKNNLDPLLKESSIKKTQKSVKENPNSNSSEIVEEILELTREQFKILRNPEMILPPDYFQSIMKEKNLKNIVDIRVLSDLEIGLRDLKSALLPIQNQGKNLYKDIFNSLNRLQRPIIYLINANKRNRNTDLFDE
jgi:TIR domain